MHLSLVCTYRRYGVCVLTTPSLTPYKGCLLQGAEVTPLWFDTSKYRGTHVHLHIVLSYTVIGAGAIEQELGGDDRGQGGSSGLEVVQAIGDIVKRISLVGSAPPLLPAAGCLRPAFLPLPMKSTIAPCRLEPG